ncbi:hypothetical protein PVAG01_08309 [Phlyctema vagabunda]|uniref:Zn(2)-C6 fungal-type domain-containing protein n=1 Tax=Phlyctema vagabunda TaxID=108571 RepID=A0ABR4P9Q6_9HELO
MVHRDKDVRETWSKKRKCSNGNGNGNGNTTTVVSAGTSATNAETEEEGPACWSCRRRKTKCSRQQPCNQCSKLNCECLYEETRERPGLKTGAVEALNKRVSMLEQMFLGQGIILSPILERAFVPQRTATNTLPSLQSRADAVRDLYMSAAQKSSSPSPAPAPASLLPEDWWTLASQTGQLPPPEVVNCLVEIYFDQIHPWIPILHITSFRQRFAQVGQQTELLTLLQAIISICLRLATNIKLPQHLRKIICRKYQQNVILASMEKFSVENLQALVIVAFDIIGSGRGPSAWSVVGSMTRTVEQLQLSVEEGENGADSNGGFFIQRIKFLRKSTSWVEEEERRRVFWNVFLMDRFCSVATGWNNSLTGADVQRRLPCEGSLWRDGQPVKTARFGISDRETLSQHNLLTPTSERQAADEEELESIGGFAFCIEASENLNLVTKFFLQYPIRYDRPDEVDLWLMRFKELDLRLVRWRLFLPNKWKNALVLNQDGIMDPNLTLAHITHNTAVMQLHQAVAYPSPDWHEAQSKLPSQISSDTCLTAAREINKIANQYLARSIGITNPQFSFCLFIAGRVLLAHSVYYQLPLDDAFDSIVKLLININRRWEGSSTEEDVQDNLASKFAKRLQEARIAALAPKITENLPTTSIDLRQPVYSEQAENQEPKATFSMGHHLPPIHQHGPEDNYSPESISLAFPPLPQSFIQYNTAIDENAAFRDLSSNENISSQEDHVHSYPPADSAIHSQDPGALPQLNSLDAIFDELNQHTLRVSMLSDPYI